MQILFQLNFFGLVLFFLFFSVCKVFFIFFRKWLVIRYPTFIYIPIRRMSSLRTIMAMIQSFDTDPDPAFLAGYSVVDPE
jgi:hypothetical protein